MVLSFISAASLQRLWHKPLFFFFFNEKIFFGCSIWDLVPPPGIEPSCSGSTES